MLAETYDEYETIREFDIIEVMVRNRFLGVQSAGGGFVRDFVGIVRGRPTRQTSNDNITRLTWRALEQKHLLNLRRVMWPAGLNNRSTFTATPAETAVKTLVAYNCTSLATTANGRWRNGDLASGMGFSIDIEADGGAGEDVSLSFAGGNLLDSLIKICELGRAYYSLDWQGGSFGGAHEWALTWGRGSDKSSGAGRVIFSTDNGTLLAPVRQYDFATGTTAVSAGQGEGILREVTLVNGVDYAADNDIELFVDARNSTTAAGRAGQAASKWEESREQTGLDFDILQTSDIFYSPVAVVGRKTYRVGDLVVTDYGGVDVLRVKRAGVTWRLSDNSQFSVTLVTELWTI
jgi:hypothetical protein